MRIKQTTHLFNRTIMPCISTSKEQDEKLLSNFNDGKKIDRKKRRSYIMQEKGNKYDLNPLIHP